MLTRTADDRTWQPASETGVERSVLRTNEQGGRTVLVRLKAGARVPRHSHGGTEEVVVLDGRVEIGGVALDKGDYLYVTAGEEHDVVGVTDAVIFVSSQRASKYVEE